MESMLPIFAVLCGTAFALVVGSALVVLLVRRRRASSGGEAPVASPQASPAACAPESSAQPQWTPVSQADPWNTGADERSRLSPGWTLTALDGPDAGRSYPLGTQSRIGRTPGLEVVINDPQVSRQHATVRYSGAGVVVGDAGSSNGTFVNGTRILQPTLLHRGDTIRVGNTRLRIEEGTSGGPAQADSYCARCGSALAPDDWACIACGTPVGAPVPVRPYAPEPSADPSNLYPAQPPRAQGHVPAPISEPVVGVVTGLARRKGLLGVQEFNIVLTDRRLILDRITNEMLNAAVYEARQAAKDEGKGFFGQLGAQMGYAGRITARYDGMTVDDILRLHPDNFSVPVDQIRKVSLRVGERAQSQLDQMVIHGPEKLRFDLKRTSASEVRAALRPVLGKRVR